MEICTAAIRPCLEPPTETVNPNSASAAEMDLKNSAYFKWKNRLDLEDKNPRASWPVDRLESPILSVDNVLRPCNARTRRGNVQI